MMLIEKKLNIGEENKVNLLPVIDIFNSVENNKLSLVKKEENLPNINLKYEESKNVLIEKLNNDFNFTNESIRKSIEINLNTLDQISNILENTPCNARLNEVLARLLESISNLIQQNLNSYRQFTDIFRNLENFQESNENKTSVNIQNAAIFTGTLKNLINSIPENPV